ncbi:hypothetical protein CBL_07845 [Carabus blaptoides fortunei]
MLHPANCNDISVWPVMGFVVQLSIYVCVRPVRVLSIASSGGVLVWRRDAPGHCVIRRSLVYIIKPNTKAVNHQVIWLTSGYKHFTQPGYIVFYSKIGQLIFATKSHHDEVCPVICAKFAYTQMQDGSVPTTVVQVLHGTKLCQTKGYLSSTKANERCLRDEYLRLSQQKMVGRE